MIVAINCTVRSRSLPNEPATAAAFIWFIGRVSRLVMRTGDNLFDTRASMIVVIRSNNGRANFASTLMCRVRGTRHGPEVRDYASPRCACLSLRVFANNRQTFSISFDVRSDILNCPRWSTTIPPSHWTHKPPKVGARSCQTIYAAAR